ncbi:dethiobiotin synthetase [Salegentibacter sp. 24]|uniref:dethiobiotin synthase n=1 Tax=Salegentibacter sp. 24 TaxID=2183986 RepID=UPI00105DB23E|nr:dethiobiotin synthase [Salegentibacter sp. 24]TDN95530.1 dethiobiotin synthetase [Salegentibacter sp. 24]
MKHTYFVTGIGTEVGKTIVSAILTESLQADYWKPIQAGDLENSDSIKVKKLVSNESIVFHKNSFALTMPMSPHAAAEIDGVKIFSNKIKRPNTDNNLIIEGAGGLMVPISDKEIIADLIQPKDRIILVSRHYLGSINHTLLTIEALKSRKLQCFGIIFSGKKNKSTESIIEKMSGVPVLGRIDQEPYFDQNIVKEYADIFREKLQ